MCARVGRKTLSSLCSTRRLWGRFFFSPNSLLVFPFFFRLFFHSRSSPFLRKVKKTQKKKVTVFSSPFRLLLLFFFVFLRRGTLKIWLAMLYEQRVILSGSPPCDRFCVVFSVFVAPNKTHGENNLRNRSLPSLYTSQPHEKT